jgi:hypothetical protein
VVLLSGHGARTAHRTARWFLAPEAPIASKLNPHPPYLLDSRPSTMQTPQTAEPRASQLALCRTRRESSSSRTVLLNCCHPRLNHADGRTQSSGHRFLGRESCKPGLRLRLEHKRVLVPSQLQRASVLHVKGQEQTRALLIRKAVFHKRKIEVFITTVQFIADDGMADVCKVNANLVFAASVRDNVEQSKWAL